MFHINLIKQTKQTTQKDTFATCNDNEGRTYVMACFNFVLFILCNGKKEDGYTQNDYALIRHNYMSDKKL